MNTSNAQQRILEEVSGLIIFPQTDSIPQDVLFIPLKEIENTHFENLLDSGLQQNNNKIPVVYFQGLRWRNPNLAQDLKRCFQTIGTIKGGRMYTKTTNVQILTGSIVFDKTQYNQPIILTDPMVEDLELILNNRRYHFRIYDPQPFDQGFGYPPILFKGMPN